MTKSKLFPFLNKYWPILAVFGLVAIFFYKVWLKGLVPIPADITVGLYFPWLDYKWGFPAGVPVRNPLPSDIVSLVFPWRETAMNLLKEGVLPLWNPGSFSGMPLLGNFQSAPLSFANIFHLFFDFITAWSLGVILQIVLASLFMYAYLRNLKLSKQASLLGSISFSFSGFFLVWLEYNVHGHAIYWLPLLFLVVDKIIVEKKNSWFLVLPFAIALQIFAGYPQLVIYSLLVTAFYAVYRFLPTRAQGLKPLFVLASGITLGLGLSSTVLLPGLEATNLSIRSIDPVAASLAARFLPWQNLVTFVAPDFFGNPATYNFWGKPYYDNFAFYVGIVPFVLAFSTIGLRKSVLFFQFLALLGLFLALPTPLSKAVAETSLFGIGSIAARSLFVFDFAIAILAAFGLEYLSRRSKEAFLSAVIPISIVAFLWALMFQYSGYKIFDVGFFENIGVLRRNLILPSLLSLFVFLVLLVSYRFRENKKLKILAPLLLILVTIFDLFRFGWKYLSFSPRSLVFPETPIIEFLQQQEKPFRVEFGEVIPENMWLPYGLESAAGYDALAPMRYNRFLGALSSQKVTNPYGRVAKIGNYESPLFDLLNVKYILAQKYTEEGRRSTEGSAKHFFDSPKLKLAFEEGSVQVYENQNALPRAFLAGNVEKVTNGQEIVDRLLSPDFDLLGSVVVEEEFPESRTPGQQEVVFQEYLPGRIKLFVSSDSPAALVLLNNYYPGWKAAVDSVPAKIYRANYTFQAIPLPEGNHSVEFFYDPESFKIGKNITLLTTIGLLLFLGFKRFKKGQRKVRQG